MKLLLTESQSLLGKAIAHALEDYPYKLISPAPDALDWTNATAVQAYVERHRPTLVINTLAVASPAAESPISAKPSVNLAQACSSRTVALHLSTYRVFGVDSCDASAFDETDLPAPTDALGKELLLAEAAFLALSKGLNLRLPWLASAHGDNIFTRVASHLTGRQTLEVSDLYCGCPTTADDVARVVLAIILQSLCGAENWGSFHLHTSDSCSEAEFADHVARLLEKAGRSTGSIEVLRNPEYQLMPGCGLLTGSRCTNNFGIQLRSWRHGLKALVNEWVAL